MAKVLFYFQVHQPYRLVDYSFFQIGKHLPYENVNLNKAVMERVALHAYQPMNSLLLKLADKYGSDFKFHFGFSGVVLEQFESYKPEVLHSFKNLISNANVSLLAETYYHSLALLFDKQEAMDQVKMHTEVLQRHFNKTPVAFRNTELIYSNEIAKIAHELGFKIVLTEYVDRLLKKSTIKKQATDPTRTQHIILRNHLASDDIAFRFSDKSHERYPVTVEIYMKRLREYADKDDIIPIFIDYETFGEHQKESSGIFLFFEQLVDAIIRDSDLSFGHFEELYADTHHLPIMDVPDYISWADTERDLSAWMSNSLQYEALHKIFALRRDVLGSQNLELIHQWRKLQTSDHFYYMSTKYWADGDVHTYFSPFNSPYDAYIYYMNIISDLEIHLRK